MSFVGEYSLHLLHIVGIVFFVLILCLCISCFCKASLIELGANEMIARIALISISITTFVSMMTLPASLLANALTAGTTVAASVAIAHFVFVECCGYVEGVDSTPQNEQNDEHETMAFANMA